ncbi:MULTISPECIES: hypothetical protein [unclassified Sedimentibacter]|uniref:hypothetical protein n=1 Tax=unclassified Sedimentibacter TaxID=2649220 RepID=UPI0027E10FAA|nr:hypothetical protein [Sedimentibacter sp. MB35-C1]WMJ76169.1 hypothetical protein RBQ61_11085 [Sedimentibacter sp. MB35-C1]
MYSELNEKMEKAQKGMNRLKKIDSMLKELKDERNQLKKKETELKSILVKENDDVEKLNKKGLASIFYSVVGKLDDKLEEEQREAIAAKLKHNQALTDLENVEYEISKLSQERTEYMDCKSQYNSLYEQKKEMLLRSDENTAKSILDISSRLNDSRNRLAELKEAVDAGNNAIRCLDKALSSLRSAEGWGTWDLLGGGLIADLAKHSKLDDTKREVEEAQVQLRKFKTELTDVKINSDIHIDTDGFAKFADFFFDGLISDWFMQSKIRNSYESVSAVKNHAEDIVIKLKKIELSEKELINSLNVELENLIMKP